MHEAVDTFRDVKAVTTSDESTPVGLIGMDVLRFFKAEIQSGKMRLSM